MLASLAEVEGLVRFDQDADGLYDQSDDSIAFKVNKSTERVQQNFAAQQNETTVSGYVFEDLNANGSEDANDGPLANATVYQDLNENGRIDVDEASTTTDANGNYTLTDLIPGEVTVRLVPPEGYHQTSPSTPVGRLFLWHTDSILREIDPANGSTIEDQSDLRNGNDPIIGEALAFDGEFLWVYDTDARDLLKINSISMEIEATIDGGDLAPFPTYIPLWNGLAFIDGLLHMSAVWGEHITIDPATGALVDYIPITSANSGSIYLSGVNRILGLGVSADGQFLTATTDIDTVLVIEPETYVITDAYSVTTDGSLSAAASAGGRLFVSETESQSLFVFDEVGNQTDTFDIGVETSALAGGTNYDLAVRLTIGVGQQISGIDFAASEFHGQISGFQFVDQNGDGVYDTDEHPAPGVAVFVDVNENGEKDVDEPFAISASDGSYTIPDVDAGNVVVRSESDFYRPSDFYPYQDRLCGLQLSFSDLRIRVIDAQTGQLQRTIRTDIPYRSGAVGMAFAQDRLIVVDNGADQIYQIDLEGNLISMASLPFTDFGPVVVGNTVYSITAEYGSLKLYEYNLETNEFVYLRPVSMDSGYGVAYSAGASADGTKILLASAGDEVYEIDPRTGVAEVIPTSSYPSNSDVGMASLRGETFVSYSGGIDVLDGDGNLLRTFSTSNLYYGLAAGTIFQNDQTVAVEVAEVADLNRGHVSTLGSIRGAIYTDANNNGMADQDEGVVSGATVYLDINGNESFDESEPSVLTDSNGVYVFQNVQPGEYSVRQNSSVGTLSRAFTENQTRLFQAIWGSEENVVVIQELDAISGKINRQFASPEPDNVGIGVAAHGNRLYVSGVGGVYVLDVDSGAVIESIAVSSGPKDGLALLDNELFVQDFSTDLIEVIDLNTNQVVRTLDISIANGYSSGGLPLGFSLSEAPDGIHLIAVSGFDSSVFIVDPDSGVIVQTIDNIYAGYGSSSAAGEYFANGYSSNGILATIAVRDQQLQSRRQIPVFYPGRVFGLGATSVSATAHDVNVLPEQSLINLDFGEVPQSSPTDILVSEQSINENSDTASNDLFFASLSADDVDVDDRHQFGLVSGQGDTDNSKFLIQGNQLLLKQGEVVDYETQSTYSIRIEAMDASGLVFEKELELSVNNLVEVTKQDITINDGSESRSGLRSLSVQFDANVSINGGAFTILKRGEGGGSVDAALNTFLDSNGHTVAELSFSGGFFESGSLIDGNYELTIDGSKIQSIDGFGVDVDGNGSTGDQLNFGTLEDDAFYRYYGDANGDRSVNLLDFGQFRTHYRSNDSDPNFRWDLDFNGDGIINLLDIGQFRARYRNLLSFE